MFHNLRYSTEKVVTVLLLLVTLIACEQAPESYSEQNTNNLVPIEFPSTIF